MTNDPVEYPDHETWVGEMIEELKQDGVAYITCEDTNPLELERRANTVREGWGDKVDVVVDVDRVVVSLPDE